MQRKLMFAFVIVVAAAGIFALPGQAYADNSCKCDYVFWKKDAGCPATTNCGSGAVTWTCGTCNGAACTPCPAILAIRCNGTTNPPAYCWYLWFACGCVVDTACPLVPC